MGETNTLNELNEILFENLRKLDSGAIDTKQATAVVNISNSIINNAKTQLAAYKLTSDPKALSAVARTDKTQLLEKKADKKEKVIENIEGYDSQLTFALSIGYKNVAEAIAVLGKTEFLRQYKAA